MAISDERKANNKAIMFRRTTALISALAIVVSLVLITTSCNSKKETEGENVEYSTKVQTGETTAVTEAPLVLMSRAEEELKINEDYAGWIKIDGVVDEPVVQCEDNDFYLNHNFDNKEEKDGGTIFVDYRNVLDTRFRSDNVVLYGHNQKDGTRFGQLDLYKWTPTYYKTHPLIKFDTAYNEREYKIFSIFIINTKPEDDDGNLFDYHNYMDLSDESIFNGFIEQCHKRSIIIPDVDIQYGDKFLTLSTCSTEFADSRLVIVAREVREGESSEVDMTNFEVNDNPLYPAIYYKYAGGSYTEE